MAARRNFAACLDVLPAAAEARHPAAPWRHELFRGVLTRLNDPDHEIPTWLAEGAPMGLASPIRPGGHFPVLSEPAAVPAESLEPLHGSDINHASLHARFDGDPEAAGWALVQKAVEDGYGEVFDDSVAAETTLGVLSTRHP